MSRQLLSHVILGSWAAITLVVIISPQTGITGVSTGVNRYQALQACPATEEEIVDLDLLADALKETKAVGLIEKIRLKSAIDKLIDRMLDFHVGRGRFTLAQLQEQYDVLLMRIASHLQHKDTILHGHLCNAWEMIWQDLENPETFTEKFS